MYKLTDNTNIIRIEDNAVIPNDLGNRDYQEYLTWVAQGNTASPAHTLDELKVLKLAEINKDADAAINGGFTYNGNTYDSDLVGRTNIIGTATAVANGLALPEGYVFRTKDNINIPTDSTALIALGSALLTHINNQYTKSWALKAQVNDPATNTPELLAAINW